MTSCLSSDTYDGICSMLLGNGSICTTLGPTGYHTPPDRRSDEAHATQLFVWAGRRDPGPRHRLTDYGSLSRVLYINGHRTPDTRWEQQLHCDRAFVVSRVFHHDLTETTRSLITLGRSIFMAETELTSSTACEVRLDILYTLGSMADWATSLGIEPDCIAIPFATNQDVGTIRISSLALNGPVPTVSITQHAVRFSYRLNVAPGLPVTPGDWQTLQEEHCAAWQDFYRRSAVITGEAAVNRFRELSLYTIRTQLTDWSIGPTLSERYWGGGAFHDEMYPFYALISGGYDELALRMPRFRLQTLGIASERARGKGALYPWSSTEKGEERDPEGLWLTERFHLAQFSAQIWAHWLYERNHEELANLYPILQSIARQIEEGLIYRDDTGTLGTRPCVDFDESVGPVRNGPFTVSGAAAALRWASDAAAVLSLDQTAAARWRSLAAELRGALVTARTEGEDGGEVFGIPTGVPLHYSVLGHIFPFATEPDSDRARRTARYIHRVCRSSRGWKPGASDAYTASNWTWAAGHLTIVHAMLGDSERAWEAVRLGPEGSGPGPTPCEHLDRHGVPRVPWFTTGVGAWLYGLHASLVWVSDDATHLWHGMPSGPWSAMHQPETPSPLPLSFSGIRGSHGVALSGEAAPPHGPVIAARAREERKGWRFALPRSVVNEARVYGRTVAETSDCITYEVDLSADREAVLIEARTMPRRS